MQRLNTFSSSIRDSQTENKMHWLNCSLEKNQRFLIMSLIRNSVKHVARSKYGCIVLQLKTLFQDERKNLCWYTTSRKFLKWEFEVFTHIHTHTGTLPSLTALGCLLRSICYLIPQFSQQAGGYFTQSSTPSLSVASMREKERNRNHLERN